MNSTTSSQSRKAGFAPILIIIAVVAFAAVGGYFYLNAKKPQVTPEAAQTKNTGSNAFTSIKDALSKSQSLRCEYTDEKGDKITTNIKAGKIRSSIVSAKNPQGMETISTSSKVYVWDNKTKKGTTLTINIEDVKEAAKNISANAQPNKKEEMVAALEKYKQSCKAEAVSDSLFTPPTDVQFTDLDAQMKKAGINMEDIKNQMKNLPQQPQGGNPSQ